MLYIYIINYNIFTRKVIIEQSQLFYRAMEVFFKYDLLGRKRYNV